MGSVLDEEISLQSRAGGPLLRSVVAVATAVLAVVFLLSGLSYPGFPVDIATCAVLAAATSVTTVLVSAVRALTTGRERAHATVVLTVVTLLFAAGVVTAGSHRSELIQVRWAASQPAFEHEVRTAVDPFPVTHSSDSGTALYQGTCPTRIGKFSIAQCRSIDGGFLFLQAQGALTDDSGIVYLPAGTGRRSEWSSETMTPLGGPWWSWTCYC